MNVKDGERALVWYIKKVYLVPISLNYPYKSLNPYHCEFPGPHHGSMVPL